MVMRLATRLAIGSAVLVSLVFVYFNVRAIHLSQPSALKLHGAPGLNDTGAEWPEAEDKVIVMAQLRNESTDWVRELLPDWQHAIYVVDDPDANLKPPENKGREAMVYLTYIIDNYDKLPSTMAFLHSHRDGWPTGWHTDAPGYDNVISASQLQLDFVQKNGYANLRCLYVPGCPDEIRPFRDPMDDDKPHEIAFAASWRELFGADVEIPQTIGTPCCSQFAASKDQVRQREKDEYVHFRHWLLDTPLNDYTSGRIMEYLWHIFMKQNPVYCPDIGRCHCDVYGRC